MAKDEAFKEAEKKIAEALQSRATELDLSGMKLTELPDSIGQLTKLQKLNLGRKKRDFTLSAWPELSESLSNLLTVLPESLGKLTMLTSLNLSGNRLTALPESLGELNQLVELDLSDNQLTALPDSLALAQLTQLTELNLHNNQLTTLPDSLSQLTQLTSLDLSSNRLIALPECIANLVSLKILVLGNSFEWQLESEMGKSVRKYVNRGQLTTLPNFIINLKNLERLEILGHQLSTLPSFLGRLENLKVLRVSGNNLTDLPPTLAQLKHLETLDLGSNELTDLPPSLAQLEHLKELNLKGNPLNPALQSAYEQGLDAVKAYLRSLETNAEPLYEAKLVLVGEGNVGKTTLLKALKGEKGHRKKAKQPHTELRLIFMD